MQGTGFSAMTSKRSGASRVNTVHPILEFHLTRCLRVWFWVWFGSIRTSHDNELANLTRVKFYGKFRNFELPERGKRRRMQCWDRKCSLSWDVRVSVALSHRRRLWDASVPSRLPCFRENRKDKIEALCPWGIPSNPSILFFLPTRSDASCATAISSRSGI